MPGIRRARPSGSVPSDPDGAAREPVERASPGLAALFEKLKHDGRHSILDLAPAEGRHLRLFGGFARQVRFAGVVPRAGSDSWARELASLAPNPDLPYDVVLAWDVLDQFDESERGQLVERLADITAPEAVLYAVVDGSGSVTRRPLAFTMVDHGRVEQRAVGPPVAARASLLPAQVERALEPFEVVHAFSLRSGLREYVARKRG